LLLLAKNFAGASFGCWIERIRRSGRSGRGSRGRGSDAGLANLFILLAENVAGARIHRGSRCGGRLGGANG
jgi:hypothetical protein